MKNGKRWISLLLALVVIFNLFPELAFSSSAEELNPASQEINDPDELHIPKNDSPEYNVQSIITDSSNVRGSDYSTKYGEKLDNIFQGKVSLFTKPADTFALGDSLNIDTEYTVAKVISGEECYIYAQGVYYYLFGDIPYHGNGYSVYWNKSVTVLSNQQSASCELFRNSGVCFGAYVRTTINSDGSYNSENGHSLIVLSYDELGITYLEGNADGKGLIRITTRTWDDFNYELLTKKGRRIAHVVAADTEEPQVKDYHLREGDISSGLTIAFDVYDNVGISEAYFVRWPQGKTEEDGQKYLCTLEKKSDGGYTATATITFDDIENDVRNFYFDWYAKDLKGNKGGRLRDDGNGDAADPKFVSFYEITVKEFGTYEAVKDDVPVRNAPYASVNGVDTEIENESLNKGDRISIIGTYTNIHGNVWYCIGEDKWVYEENLKFKLIASVLDWITHKYEDQKITVIDGQVFPIIGVSTATENETKVVVSGRPYALLAGNDGSYETVVYSQCTVQFNANGGYNTKSSKTVSTGSVYGVLPSPYRFGYTFNGWFTAAEGGEQVTSEMVCSLEGSQTLYAQWTRTVLSEGSCGDNMTYILYGDGELIITGSGEMTSHPWTTDYAERVVDVVMEGEITSICESAFNGCTYLADIQMPDTVTIIGNSAFQNCSSLSYIDLSDSLMSISDYTFEGCTQLMDVDMPNLITTIGLYSFSGCSALEMITIPDAVTTIGSRAFYNCTNLATVNYSKSLESVTPYGHGTWGDAQYDGPFSGCTSLTSIVVPDGVTAVPGYVFYNCTALKDVELPDSLTSIGSNAFAGCTSLESIHIPDSVTDITGRAFYNCTSLTTVNYPRAWNNVSSWFYWDFFSRSYWDGPFSGCSSLSNVAVPDGVTAIPTYAFQNCTGLNSISLPNSLRTINNNAFYGCTGLGYIELPDGVTSIGSQVFQQSGLIEIVIPDTVTSTGDHILADCLNLKTVTWTLGGTTVPEYAFAGSTALEEVYLPDSVTRFNKGVFRDCDSLVTQKLPASLSVMGDETFYDCNVLDTVLIPSSVSTIGNNAFYNCDALMDVTILDGVKSLAENAFYDCDALQSIVIPGSVTSIGGAAFYDCDALSSVSVSYGVTSIGNSAFYDCDALETVDMANSVTSLGTNVFYHNDVLKNVNLSRNLTSIPTGTFKECALLEEIVIPYFTTSIGDNAFSSSTKLSKVVTHENLTSISSSAFSYPNVTIFYGTAGSYTETWAGENGYTFVENTAAATAVTLAETEVSIPKGVTYNLDMTIDPADFADTITFKSGNASVATVDETGKITAVAPGTATIKVIVGDASASCKVTVSQAVTKITLDKTSLALDVPDTHQLTATIAPTDATNQTLEWTSSNEAAATVDENGLITAVGNGTAVITATATDGTGISASCTVTVTDPNNVPVSGITLDKTSLTMEALDTDQLTATVSPDDAANKNLTWSSSDESVATVDENGTVTAVAKGTAAITAIAADGSGISASCSVTVINNAFIVDDVSGLESSHNYPSSCNDFWVYTMTDAEGLYVTFDAQTEMEDGFDYLHIYDGAGNLIGTYTGTELAGQTVEIPGDTVKIQIESDDSGSEWGFKVAEVAAKMHTHIYENGVCTICGKEEESDSVVRNTTTGNAYATLLEAVKAAGNGETLTLVSDCAEEEFMLLPGVTLDLNGFVLTVDYCVAFESAHIVDNVGTGRLITGLKSMVLDESNAMIPVYTGDAYVFTKAGFALRQDNSYTGDGIKINTLAYPVNMDAVELLKDGSEDNNIQIILQLSWDTDQGTGSQEFLFSDQVVADVYSSNNGSWSSYSKMFSMTITGFENIENLKARLVVASGTDVRYISSASISIT